MRRTSSVVPSPRRLLAACAAVALVSALVVGVRSPAGAAVGASIHLAPAVGPPTTRVTVTGAGFGAAESVSVQFDTTELATTSTDDNGSFSSSSIVPSTASPGPHEITAEGQSSGTSAGHGFLVQTDWPTFMFDPASSGFNPYENVIGEESVSGLEVAWTGDLESRVVYSSPVIARGVAYIASEEGLYAFSADGSTNCSGTPKSCQPLWTADNWSRGTPAVAKGTVYIVHGSSLYAYSAAGAKKCSGTPLTCRPLWSADLHNNLASRLSPVVSGGTVYVGSSDKKLYAFSADGKTNCSGKPKTCRPLWTGLTQQSITTPAAVANGVVYVGSDKWHPGIEYAFSADGTTNCSGTRKTKCLPLWTYETPSAIGLAPAVANGVLYVADEGGTLSAFSADGTTNCGGTPKACAPLWISDYGRSFHASPAVANGVVYTATNDTVLAFSAEANADCMGSTTKECPPVWSAEGQSFQWESPAVANGVVYLRGYDGLFAFSAAGSTNCGGTPKLCGPLWDETGTGGTGAISSPAVADGFVYIGSADGELVAFHL